MTDSRGKVIDFTQTIIVMTSNLGVSDISKQQSGFSIGDSYQIRSEVAEQKILSSLKTAFKPELINRIDEKIIFNEISPETAEKITRKELKTISKYMGNSSFLLEEVPVKVVERISSLAEISKFGARDIQRTIHREVSTKIARRIVSHTEGNSKNLLLDIDDNGEIIVKDSLIGEASAR